MIRKQNKRADFPGDSEGKASAYNAEDPGSILGSGRSSGEGNGNPLQWKMATHLPGKSHGWRSVVSYSSAGHTESDITERPHFALLQHVIRKQNKTAGTKTWKW